MGSAEMSCTEVSATEVSSSEVTSSAEVSASEMPAAKMAATVASAKMPATVATSTTTPARLNTRSCCDSNDKCHNDRTKLQKLSHLAVRPKECCGNSPGRSFNVSISAMVPGDRSRSRLHSG